MAHDTETTFLNASGVEKTAATLDAIKGKVTNVFLSLDTSAYSSGDLLAATQVISDVFRFADEQGELVSVTVLDKDDQGAAFDLYFLDSNASFGTENSAPTITDTAAEYILCIVPIATGDYKDLGACRVANIKNIGAIIKPATGTKNIYVAAVNGSGTPTYTAAGIQLRIGVK